MVTSFTDWESGAYLQHYGVKGMRWGVRKDRPSSGETLFVSGSSKTQDKASPYYRRRLPKMVRSILKNSIRKGDTVIVGDAPGIDRQVQDWLKKKHYDKVEIYGPGQKVRYSANKKWKTNPVNDPDHEEGSKEWLAKKDVAMANRSTKGLAVILDEGSSATRKNVQRLIEQNKQVRIYELNKSSKSLIRGLQDPGDQEVDYFFNGRQNYENHNATFFGHKHNRRAANGSL